MQRAVRTAAHIATWATLFDKGIPYLERAIQAGEERAHYALAVIYIKRGETNNLVSRGAKRYAAETRPGPSAPQPLLA